MVQMHGDSPGNLISADVIAREALSYFCGEVIFPYLSNDLSQEGINVDHSDNHAIATVRRSPIVRANRGQKIVNHDINECVEICVKQHNVPIYDLDPPYDIVSLGERYLKSVGEELAGTYDDAWFEELSTSFFYMRGTPGTAIAPDSFRMALADADRVAIPDCSQRIAILDPEDAEAISFILQSGPASEMPGSAFDISYKGIINGCKVYASSRIKPLEIPSQAGHTPVLHARSLVRGNDICVGGLARSKKWLNKGNLISIAGCNEVQPRRSGKKTGHKATFVVTEDVTADEYGNASIHIYPYINDGELMVKLADGSNNIKLKGFETVDTVPAAGAVIAVVGGSSDGKKYRQSILYNKQSMGYLMLPLPDLMFSNYSAQETDEETGLSISVLGDVEFNTRRDRLRFDTRFGVKNIYPEFGMRLISAEC